MFKWIKRLFGFEDVKEAIAPKPLLNEAPKPKKKAPVKRKAPAKKRTRKTK